MKINGTALRRSCVLAALYALGIGGIVASGGGGGGGGGGTPVASVVASFTVTPSSGAVPLDVTFNASASSTTQGSLTAYEWDFGDSSSLNTTSPTATHRYTSAATHTVRLTVRTSSNQSATTTRTVTATTPQQAIWLGGYLSEFYPDSAIRADLTLSGNTISGPYQDDDDRTGTVSMTISGTTVSAQLMETTPGCSGSFTGTGSVDVSLGVSLVFIDFTGANCDGPHTFGELVLVEQRAEVLSWGHGGLAALRVDDGELFFTDASEYPLKKIDTATGTITPLAYAMRAISSLTVAGSNMLWTDFTDDIGETGCVGAGAVRALVYAGSDGFDPHRIAEGDFCTAPIQESVLTDGFYAYWARVDGAGPFIERVPLAGGPRELVAALAFGANVLFAIDATDIYWTESFGLGETNTIKRCPLAGCGLASPITVTQDTTYAIEGGIVLNGDEVYVGLHRENTFAPAIARVAKTGGTLVDIIQDASARGLATDGTDLFWWDSDNFSISQIETAPVGGGTPMPLADSLVSLRGLALSPTHVYWIEGTSGTNQNDGRVARVPKVGGTIDDIKTDAVWPEHLQVDPTTGTAIYADGGADELREQGIRRVTLGGVTTTLAKGIPASQPFAVSASTVFVSSGFTIATLPRTGLDIAATLAPAASYVIGMETDGSTVYWLTGDPQGIVVSSPATGTQTPALIGAADGYTSRLRQNTNDLFVNRLPGTVYRMPKTGGTRDTLADTLAFPDELAVDDSYAYVVESDARAITRIDLATLARTNAASNIPLFTGWFTLEHDSNALYLMSPEALQRYSKSTGAVSEPYGPVFQDEFGLPAEVAVDGTYVYWVDALLGAVLRMPK